MSSRMMSIDQVLCWDHREPLRPPYIPKVILT